MLKVLEFGPSLVEFVALAKLLRFTILFTIEHLICTDKIGFLALLLVVGRLSQADWAVLFLFALILVIHVMMLLKHANIGLPAKVTCVYLLNEQVHLVRWYVIVMWIASLTTGTLMDLHFSASGRLCSTGGAQLHKCLLNRSAGPGNRLLWLCCLWGWRLLLISLDGSLCWHGWLRVGVWLGIFAVSVTLGHLLLGLVCSFLGIFIADFSNLNSTATSVMPRNFGILKLITTSHGLGSLNIQVFVLATVEALNVVLGQATLGAAHTRHTLHEADHGLPTVRVEGSVVAGVNISHQKSLLILNWVGGQRRFGIVSEVGNKSLSIL